jgi:hypothetical protein
MSSEMSPSAHIELSQDAAVVAALASTAMTFSHSAEDQAERWLRVLRMHGEVGSALQALGVGEAPLETRPERTAGSPPLGSDAVDRVVRRACEHAAAREAPVVCTSDLLIALFEVYGDLIDHALQERGASREELLERLAETGRAVEA